MELLVSGPGFHGLRRIDLGYYRVDAEFIIVWAVEQGFGDGPAIGYLHLTDCKCFNQVRPTLLDLILLPHLRPIIELHATLGKRLSFR